MSNPLKDLYKEVVKRYCNDPYGFVMASFQWNKGSLLNRQPEAWQKQILDKIKEGLPVSEVLRLAVASGHGV